MTILTTALTPPTSNTSSRVPASIASTHVSMSAVSMTTPPLITTAAPTAPPLTDSSTAPSASPIIPVAAAVAGAVLLVAVVLLLVLRRRRQQRQQPSQGTVSMVVLGGSSPVATRARAWSPNFYLGGALPATWGGDRGRAMPLEGAGQEGYASSEASGPGYQEVGSQGAAYQEMRGPGYQELHAPVAEEATGFLQHNAAYNCAVERRASGDASSTVTPMLMMSGYATPSTPSVYATPGPVSTYSSLEGEHHRAGVSGTEYHTLGDPAHPASTYSRLEGKHHRAGVSGSEYYRLGDPAQPGSSVALPAASGAGYVVKWEVGQAAPGLGMDDYSQPRPFVAPAVYSQPRAASILQNDLSTA